MGSQCRWARRARRMGGGGTIVDGFRRLFHRRNGSTSNSHQSSVAGEGEEGSPDLEVIEDPDLVGLRAIRVPKRKMPLPVESHKKVSNPAPRFSCFACCCGFLVILDSRSREISRQDWIFMSAACFHTYTISCQVPCFFPHMHSETVLAKLVSYCL